MCKELTEELAIGSYLAKELVLHLNRMGACGGTIPIEMENNKYEIKIINLGVDNH